MRQDVVCIVSYCVSVCTAYSGSVGEIELCSDRVRHLLGCNAAAEDHIIRVACNSCLADLNLLGPAVNGEQHVVISVDVFRIQLHPVVNADIACET